MQNHFLIALNLITSVLVMGYCLFVVFSITLLTVFISIMATLITLIFVNFLYTMIKEPCVKLVIKIKKHFKRNKSNSKVKN